jgi:hypothetical protein
MQQRSVVSSIYPCQILTASFIYFLGIFLFGCIIYSKFQLTYTSNNIVLMRYIYLSKHLKAHLVSESFLCDTAVLLLYTNVRFQRYISKRNWFKLHRIGEPNKVTSGRLYKVFFFVLFLEMEASTNSWWYTHKRLRLPAFAYYYWMLTSNSITNKLILLTTTGCWHLIQSPLTTLCVYDDMYYVYPCHCVDHS